ncbi:S-adenosyl-L-methionine-dependent methyltransferase [Mycotypha africana]|uniref:S-adenosyl-L-methionine-dependent methyltransferase n=1 Tax=Mycotypha africana TaxID=64632 RepID=UPI00230122A2|nr:S-adenosyl-L-methionine-dependent methyltransferase [Mycotypha africana]KAI8975192.1 S-adenosyl-L-methionine-dependent methyltransferase [Mycotypha africana]
MYKISRRTISSPVTASLCCSSTRPTTAKRAYHYPGFFTSFWLNRHYHNNDEPPTAEKLQSYPIRTSRELRTQKIPPKRSKMLLRDFVDDALFNPNYGYYSSATSLLSSPNKQSQMDRENVEDEHYIHYRNRGKVRRQQEQQQHMPLRYTLTELFKSLYGHAIAKYMVTEYKLKLYPHKDLIIYEIIGGNGRLMPHILDYIEKYEPQIYKRTQYTLIELSDRIVSPAFLKDISTKHHPMVTSLNENIFDWNTLVTEQCFFLGMEVVNHFAHDVVKYDLDTLQCYQGMICVDEKRNYSEVFTPLSDPLIAKYLKVQEKVLDYDVQSKKRRLSQLQPNSLASKFYSLFFNSSDSTETTVRHHIHSDNQTNNSNDHTNRNLSLPEYLPTKLFEFLHILSTYFPSHRLILTDYDKIFTNRRGINAPLIQIPLYNDDPWIQTTISDDYLLPPGWFDILFPTNFDLLKDIYLTAFNTGTRFQNNVKSMNYSDFLDRYHTSILTDKDKKNRKKNSKKSHQQFMHSSHIKIFLT